MASCESKNFSLLIKQFNELLHELDSSDDVLNHSNNTLSGSVSSLSLSLETEQNSISKVCQGKIYQNLIQAKTTQFLKEFKKYIKKYGTNKNKIEKIKLFIKQKCSSFIPNSQREFLLDTQLLDKIEAICEKTLKNLSESTQFIDSTQALNSQNKPRVYVINTYKPEQLVFPLELSLIENHESKVNNEIISLTDFKLLLEKDVDAAMNIAINWVEAADDELSQNSLKLVFPLILDFDKQSENWPQNEKRFYAVEIAHMCIGKDDEVSKAIVAEVYNYLEKINKNLPETNKTHLLLKAFRQNELINPPEVESAETEIVQSDFNGLVFEMDNL